MPASRNNRRDVISGNVGLRNRTRINALGRTPENFTVCLSDGPFAGVDVVNNKNVAQQPNGDERLSHFGGSFTKGLEHAPDTGLVATPYDYLDLVEILTGIRANTEFPDPEALSSIDSVRRALSVPKQDARRYVNPLAAVAGGGTGVDAFDVKLPPAPQLASRQAGTELIELYWMALLRDTPFAQWDGCESAGAATEELNRLNAPEPRLGEERFTQHYGADGQLAADITTQRLFRGSAPGDDVGPYVSQFLLQDIPYGTYTIAQKQHRLADRADYLDTWEAWLTTQNGLDTARSRAQLEDRQQPQRHIVTLRDLAHYVHFDVFHQAFLNAALILDGMAAPLSDTNPYRESATQEGFGVFGKPHILSAIAEVGARALRVAWHQKWLVHRRLRPEAMAARAERQRAGDVVDLLDGAVFESTAAERLLARNDNLLLPQAYPEGAPMHPSYASGHATVAGACATLLKAFFKNDFVLADAKQAVLEPDGSTRLEDHAQALTVEGEINKLAANIAIGRMAAGVNYRSDYAKSLALGEAVTIAMLQEQAMELKEGTSCDAIAFEFNNFSGRKVQITYAGQALCNQSGYQAPQTFRCVSA